MSSDIVSDNKRDSSQPNIFILLLLVAAALRLTNLGTFSLWLDEYTSIEVARKPLTDIITGKGFDSHTPPFYYVLLHFYFSLLDLLGIGVTEFSLRFPSVVIDLFSLSVLFSLAKTFFGERVAIGAAALYAFAEYPIYFAQEGRMYSLLSLECLLTLRLLFPLVNLTRLQTALLALIAVCGLYTHYYYAFFTLGVGISLLFERRSQYFFRGVSAFAIAGVFFLPWINVVLKLAASEGQTFRQFSLITIPYSLFRFVAGYSVFPLDSIVKADQSAAIKGSIVLLSLYLLLGAVLIFFGLFALRKHSVQVVRFLLIPVLTSTVIPLLISLKTQMFSERYLSGVFPLYCIIVSLGLSHLARGGRAIIVTALYLAIIFSLFCHYGGAPRFQKEQWRDVVHYLRDNNLTKEVYVDPAFITPLFRHYCSECGIHPYSELKTNLSNSFILLRRGDGEAARFSDLKEQVLASFPAESGLNVLRVKRDIPQ